MVEAHLQQEPYEVLDPATGNVRTLLHEQVQLDVPEQLDGVYSISPSEGWVLVRARDTLGGPDVMLASRLFWGTSQETIRINVGVVVAKETALVHVPYQARRMTWTGDGEFWAMHVLP